MRDRIVGSSNRSPFDVFTDELVPDPLMRLLDGAPRALLNRQRDSGGRMLPDVMTLQRIKMTVSAIWVLIATVIAISVDLSWTRGIALTAFGLLPPLALLLLWNEPAATMSESINEGRR